MGLKYPDRDAAVEMVMKAVREHAVCGEEHAGDASSVPLFSGYDYFIFRSSGQTHIVLREVYTAPTWAVDSRGERVQAVASKYVSCVACRLIVSRPPSE